MFQPGVCSAPLFHPSTAEEVHCYRSVLPVLDSGEPVCIPGSLRVGEWHEHGVFRTHSSRPELFVDSQSKQHKMLVPKGLVNLFHIEQIFVCVGNKAFIFGSQRGAASTKNGKVFSNPLFTTK